MSKNLAVCGACLIASFPPASHYYQWPSSTSRPPAPLRTPIQYLLQYPFGAAARATTLALTRHYSIPLNNKIIIKKFNDDTLLFRMKRKYEVHCWILSPYQYSSCLVRTPRMRAHAELVHFPGAS